MNWTGRGVTEIGESVFDGCSALTTVVISEGVTKIGKLAFRDCTSLKEVVIPSSVKTIEKAAFKGCTSLESIAIPDGVTSIGNYAFYNCSGLTSVTIPDGVTEIEAFAFSESGLEAVTLPSSVEKVEAAAFSGCANLETALLPAGLKATLNTQFRACPKLKEIQEFGARLAEGYRGFKAAVDAWEVAGEAEKAAKADEVLKALGGYRVLCVTRHGPQGTEAVNRAAAALLFPGRGKDDHYDGRVVMVLKNNRDIGLYNGDVGVVLGGKAWFAAEGGTKSVPKSVPVFLLPEHETAFAMTVHKSQGSEFQCVTVVLPEKGCEALLRRELVYTAITRTRTRVDLWCTPVAFATAVETKTERNTGLRAKLDWGGEG